MREPSLGIHCASQDTAWSGLSKSHTAARLAQSVERKALNLVVVGSSPTVGVLMYSHVQLHMHQMMIDVDHGDQRMA